MLSAVRVCISSMMWIVLGVKFDYAEGKTPFKENYQHIQQIGIFSSDIVRKVWPTTNNSVFAVPHRDVANRKVCSLYA